MWDLQRSTGGPGLPELAVPGLSVTAVSISEEDTKKSVRSHFFKNLAFLQIMC